MPEQKSGYLLIDKPAGWTSFDVVAKLRGITGINKIGHAGTLDPFATGLLIVAVGREATRRIEGFMKLDKEYIATLRLGAESDTFDRDGVVVPSKNAQDPGIEKFQKAAKQFIGPQKQTPPMFSAKKINGQKLYKLARQGKEVKREAVGIVVSEIGVLRYAYPLAELRFTVSSGAYIRALAHDIGQELGIGAYLEELRRIRIGRFSIEKAGSLAGLNRENWVDHLFDV